jgi:adhesin/invasin
MHKYFFSITLIFLSILTLTSCGGGSDEPSILLADTGGNPGGTPPAETDNEPQNVTVFSQTQTLIPSGGSTIVKLVTFEEIDPEEENPSYVTEPNVTMAVTVISGNAELHNVPRSSNPNGEASFTVSHPGSGNVTLNIKGTGRYQGGFLLDLYFGAQVSSELITPGMIPADGTTPAEIKVFIRDWAGFGIAGIPVDLSFPLNSFAVPIQASGSSDINGEYTASITNTVPQTTKVIPIAGGLEVGSLALTFGTSQVAQAPEILDLIIKSNNVLANGQSQATLVVIARNANQAPLPNVPVNISSNSATARLRIGEDIRTLFINATTGATGRFDLEVSNTVEETVDIVAITTSGDTTERSAQESLIFVAPDDGSSNNGENPVGSVVLDNPINNGQPASGNAEDAITLRGRVLDNTGTPIAGKEVSIIVSGGSAQIEMMNNGATDVSGRFFATLTDTVVEEFSARAVVGEVTSNVVNVRFTAIPIEPEEVPTPPTPPNRITLLASPTSQLANGADQIILTAVVRNNQNVPMEGINVSVAADNNFPSALFDVGLQTTDAGGRAVFNLSSQEVGSVTVTAQAWVEDADGNIVGSTISDTQRVSFRAEATETLDVTQLDVNVVNNNQPATGQDPIQIDVVARNAQGAAVEGAPILVQMSSGKAAVASPSRSDTDANGFFTTNITSTQAGEITITIAVEGLTSVSETRKIIFAAQTGAEASLNTVDLNVINNNQPADGESKITLIATPRDNNGVPLADVNIQLIDESDNVEIPAGTTNPLGEYRVPITSTVAESFNVTAVANENVIGDSVRVTFTPLEDTRNTINLRVENNNQPADGESNIALVVKFTDVNGNPIPNATVSFIDDSSTVTISGGTTNAIGEFRTFISSTVPETFTVIPVVNGIAGTEKSVTFVSSGSKVTHLTVSIVTNNQAANGKDPIQINVIAKDSSGFPVSGAIIEVRLPNVPGSVAAIATPAQKATDENGLFSTELTSTEAGDVTVNIGVKNSTLPPHTEIVTFVASSEVTPHSIELQVYNDLQLADGQSAITLVAIPRDVNGTPIAGVPVELIADSATVAIANSTGNTNALGELRATATNTVAQTVNVTPVTGGLTGSSIPITFLPVGEKVAELQVNLIDNNQLINGNPVRLEVITRDSNGNAVPNVPIVVQMPAGTAAVATPPQGNTSENGTFSTEISSSIAGDVNVTIAIPGATTVSAQTKTVTFLPIVSGIDKVAELQVTVVESTNNRLANGTDGVRIDVVARDSGGRALPEVPIVVQMPTGTAAVATPASGITEDNGTFFTEITSTIPGDVTVTISVQGTTIAHPPVMVTFIALAGVTPTTVELIVENAPQPANGESQITLLVIPRDARGNPVAGVDVQLIKDSPAIVIAEESGTTDALGRFRTTVTTAQDMSDTLTDLLEVTITPIAAGIKGDPTTVIFTPVDVPIPATLSLTIINNNQEVGQEITLSALATDVNNFPMKDVPIKLSLAPADPPEPDVTHSVVFGSNGFEGKTAATSGTFRTTLTNNLPGKFKVTASVVGVGDVPILNSNTVEVIFKSAPTDEVKEVTSLQLITDKTQLPSGKTDAGDPQEALITAIVKNKDNNLVEGAIVSFSADSGEIQLVQIEESTALPGVTDASGRAQARLTSADPTNRTITVQATVPTTTGEIREDSITIEIIGTQLTIDGPGSVVQNAEATFTIALLDANKKGIAGQTINVKSELANTLNNNAAEINPVTDANGRLQVTYLAINPGEDTLTASKAGAQDSKAKITITNDQFTVAPLPASHGRCTSLENNEDINNNRILDPGEDINSNGQLDLGCQIPVGQEQSFEIQWLQGGSPKAFEKIFLSSTRGTLKSDTVSTDINGNATFTLVSANDLGNAIVTVSTSDPAGPSPQFAVKFVALNATSITIQATPPVIGVNLGDNDIQRSEILAVVRDNANNLVFGKRVDFVLQDITGGHLSQGFDITDDFGRAQTEYIAGASASATNGVVVKATVSDTPSVSKSVSLTVAQKGLFVTLGSGNELEKDAGIRYKVFHTVLVTDSNGTPVNGALVTLSAYTSTYLKGPKPGTSGESLSDFYLCPNEDTNRNGILDPGEDINGNGRLEPGNVVTVDNLTLTTGQANPPNHPDTPQSGFADFDVLYAIQYAAWVEAEITARASVEGSEGQSVIPFQAVCSAEDIKNESCPVQNPFGFGDCNQPN